MIMHGYPKKANKLYLFIVGITRNFFLKNWSIKVTNTVSNQIKPPYCILSNHESNIDSFITASTLYPTKLNYVIADYHYRNSIKRLALRLMGTIPKEQFYPDVNAIIEMKRVIKRGDVLMLFPAGQSSYTGACTYIPEGIGRLIKLLNTTILQVHIDGAHLAYPKWDMSHIRKTQIHVKIEELLSAGQVRDLSENEINGIVLNALQFDDYEWQRKHMLPYKKIRKVEGLDAILFCCPSCGSEFTIAASRNQLTCHACKLQATMDSYGFLHFDHMELKYLDTPVKWYQWQVNALSDKIASDKQYTFTCQSTMYIAANKKSFKRIGVGELSISRAGLRFRMDGKQERVFDLSHQPTFPFESTKYFELPYEDKLFRFVFELKGAACKYVMICELLYKLSK